MSDSASSPDLHTIFGIEESSVSEHEPAVEIEPAAPSDAEEGYEGNVSRGASPARAGVQGTDAPALLGEVIPILLAHALDPAPDPLAVLTAREREVLGCMVEGLNRSEIAASLNMSGNTVRTHTQNLIGKLGAHSSLEAVTIALRSSNNRDVGVAQQTR